MSDGARRASSSARWPPPPPARLDLDLPIEDLDLSERPRNCLKRAAGQHRSASSSTKTEDDLLAITNFGQKSLDEVIAEARRARPVAAHQGLAYRSHARTPKKGRRFGGNAAHQRLMMANLVASLVAAEGIVTTEAKAKALRPIAEKVITKAKKGGLPQPIRQVVSYLGDKEMAHKLFTEIGPRYADRNGGYTADPEARPAPGRATPRWRASSSSERTAPA